MTTSITAIIESNKPSQTFISPTYPQINVVTTQQDNLNEDQTTYNEFEYRNGDVLYATTQDNQPMSLEVVSLLEGFPGEGSTIGSCFEVRERPSSSRQQRFHGATKIYDFTRAPRLRQIYGLPKLDDHRARKFNEFMKSRRLHGYITDMGRRLDVRQLESSVLNELLDDDCIPGQMTAFELLDLAMMNKQELLQELVTEDVLHQPDEAEEEAFLWMTMQEEYQRERELYRYLSHWSAKSFPQFRHAIGVRRAAPAGGPRSADEVHQHPAIVMELMPGSTLATIVKSSQTSAGQPLPNRSVHLKNTPQTMADWYLVLDGIHTAMFGLPWSLGLQYTDIRLENVLVHYSESHEWVISVVDVAALRLISGESECLKRQLRPTEHYISATTLLQDSRMVRASTPVDIGFEESFEYQIRQAGRSLGLSFTDFLATLITRRRRTFSGTAGVRNTTFWRLQMEVLVLNIRNSGISDPYGRLLVTVLRMARQLMEQELKMQPYTEWYQRVAVRLSLLIAEDVSTKLQDYWLFLDQVGQHIGLVMQYEPESCEDTAEKGMMKLAQAYPMPLTCLWDVAEVDVNSIIDRLHIRFSRHV